MLNYIEVPTYNAIDNSYYKTPFKTKESFINYIEPLLKYPGEYNFNQDYLFVQNEGNKFKEQGYYCNKPFKSKDYITYWDNEKDKCRNGLLIIGNLGNKWYVPRDYYMWLNFLPIYHKEKRINLFPDLYDGQYHIALYEFIADLKGLHIVFLKKRQYAMSFYHMAKLINQVWFEKGVTLKLLAYEDSYINMEGSWDFLVQYRDFLNEHTAWYRPFQPDEVGNWNQRIKVSENGRDNFRGNKGRIIGKSTKQSSTKGVGGSSRYIIVEEAGVNPNLDKTYGYAKAALQAGPLLTTGQFIAYGSVGDLKQCEPLKEFMKKPIENGFYGIPCRDYDASGVEKIAGLFAPEFWNLQGYTDVYGNSDIQGAKRALLDLRIQQKKDLNPEAYQLEISQHPMTIEEAFAFREESPFPTHLIAKQLDRINNHTYPSENLDIYRDNKGEIQVKKSKKLPISEFPLPKKTASYDKEGCMVVYERPDKDKQWGVYYASIDPLTEGRAEYINNLIYTPYGRKKIGDIIPGDYVISNDGKPTLVTNTYPQGKKDLYRVTFTDNTSVLVCEDHLWSVELRGGTRGFITLSTKDLIDKNKTIILKGKGRNIEKKYCIKTYYRDNRTHLKWRIPLTKPIEFNKNKDLKINPYLLGLLLGDGGFSTRSIRYTTIDLELIDYIKEILPNDLEIKKINSLYGYTITTKSGARNSLMFELRNLGLQGKNSHNKFIPNDYKYASINDRLELLRGLMDTDGYCGNHGAEFYSISFELANGVVELVQSLGGIAKIRKKKTNQNKKGLVKKSCGYIYLVRVILPLCLNPFKLKRKAEKYYEPRKYYRYISNIQYEKSDEAVCISVDSPTKLYLTENAIVTHNSTTSVSLCSIFIYKRSIKITKQKDDGTLETFIEGDKIVAEWCGRYDDINKTHEQLELMIEWYNAWTLVEANIPTFFTYMTLKKKTHYLVPSNQFIFNKELANNHKPNHPWGWKNVGTIFKTHLLSSAIEYMTEELSYDVLPNGDKVNIIYGIERIPSKMLLIECKDYVPGLNVDRLVSFAALVAFAKMQQASRDNFTKYYKNENYKEVKVNVNTIKPFRNVGKTMYTGTRKSGFRNLK